MKRGTVLVVEDEPLVRTDAAGFLAEEGFEALEAANAKDAIAMLRKRPDIDVVFTDVNMPGPIDGLKLVEIVRRKWPLVFVIVTSGQHFPREEDMPACSCFIPKPYTPEQVVRAVELFAA